MKLFWESNNNLSDKGGIMNSFYSTNNQFSTTVVNKNTPLRTQEDKNT